VCVVFLFLMLVLDVLSAFSDRRLHVGTAIVAAGTYNSHLALIASLVAQGATAWAAWPWSFGASFANLAPGPRRRKCQGLAGLLGAKATDSSCHFGSMGCHPSTRGWHQMSAVGWHFLTAIVTAAPQLRWRPLRRAAVLARKKRCKLGMFPLSTIEANTRCGRRANTFWVVSCNP